MLDVIKQHKVHTGMREPNNVVVKAQACMNVVSTSDDGNRDASFHLALFILRRDKYQNYVLYWYVALSH